MNREIPGYYYDEEKKKYFKIEDSKTTPAQAAWSTRSVKWRLVETKEEELKRERLARNAGRVKRATRVWNEPLIGGCFLAREVGGGPPGTKLEDMRGEAWTMGLRDKGKFKMWPMTLEDQGSITLMYVGGEEAEGGMGIVHASLNDGRFQSSYTPRDEQDEINFKDIPARVNRGELRRSYSHPFPPFEEMRASESMPSSLRYHPPTQMMLATSRWSDLSVRIYTCTVRDLGLKRIAGVRTTAGSGALAGERKIVNTLTPAPASSRLFCAVGTNVGIVTWQDDHRLSWLTSCPPSKRRSHHQPISRPHGLGRNTSHDNLTDLIDDSEENKNIHDEIFSLDFHGKNPADVIIAGGQSRNICLIDMRCPEREWMASYIRHTSSVAHVKSISEYEVLAAGPMNAMAIYDVRFDRYCNYIPNTTGCGDRHPYPHNRGGDGSSRDATNSWAPTRGGGAQGGRNSSGARTAMPVKGSMPVVQFPEYKNGPHLMQIGFDVLHGRDNSGVGIVAAAHDNGTVGLFSLRSGRKLRSPAIDAIQLRGTGNIVKSLMFQTLPGDVHPSLFVGQGSVVKKYSFGMSYRKTGGCVFEEEDWGET